MKLRPVSLAALALFAGLSSQAFAQERRTYIVQLAGEPAVSYTGGVEGYAATKPLEGQRFVFQTDTVQAYIGYLDGKQRSVASLVGDAPILANYNTVLNGFAASLTEAEVLTLRANAQVIDIQADEPRHMTTTSTSAFLGLSSPGGLWSQVVNGSLNKGENIVVGVIDGGIWPENPAFADKVDANGVPTHGAGTVVYAAPVGWNGTCVAGSGFTPAQHCNNKLIGARFFNAGFNANQPVLHWTDFASSPRDSVAGPNGHGGHGTHTSSTAAGNSANPVTLAGIAMGNASGMAPRARVAMYKVCWTFPNAAATDGTGSQNTCYTTDSVAAIDKAVQDGVNVINYSISGSQTSVNDAVEQAFLRASNAGVFVAASAGNSGPAQAVAHISPWLTTVAASTHSRFNQGDVTLGNGFKYSGASLNTTPLASTPMVRAEDAGLGGGNANLCFSSGPPAGQVLLDPAKVAGKIVVCTRGTNARVDKSFAVAQAGGLGMVLVDNGSGLVAEAHSVPTVHVSAADGSAIKTYVVGAAATAAGSISAFYTGSVPAPIMASFSSRGPNAADSNMLKPDLTAPGVDVIAGVTADLSQAQHDAVANGTLVPPADFASYQGTSMSSPHVAGIAALLKQAHPTWSPAAIKSALMTTTVSTLNDGQPGLANGLLPWSQGAGHIVPNRATDPGLVFDNSSTDWIRYQCKVNAAAVTTPAPNNCATLGAIDETYNVNVPSITVGAVTGTTTVTRKVTNVGVTTATYTPSIAAPTGFTAVVAPSSLTLASGATGTFTVRLAAAGAAENVWGYGSLTWSDGTHNVKIPVTARAGKAITAPDLLTGTTASGTRLVTIKSGFTGKMTVNKGGLKDVTMGAPVSLTPGGLTSAQLKAACQTGNDLANVKVYNVAIPAGTLVTRFALRDADVGAAGDDNDMGLLAPDGTWVYSGNDGSNEAVQMASPAAGNYRVCVVAWAGAPTMTHKLSGWVVTPADIGGKFNVMVPGSVFAGSTATVGISWSGLGANGRYVGGVQYKDLAGNVQATTVVRVETGAAPLAQAAREPSARELSKLE
jgi:subtilisin family serine protease